ncbi:MAG TPA: hypothetical protein HA359_07185 [Candidatus Poseidoniaceae archaeon]|nr:hypothetical protein [Candidatus Poseidoniaceae archaeon]HII49943.1 hypothetical protein [Candidatus Poseidoniaceae archaeon]
MGISYANVQRMLIVVAAITIITAFTTMEAFTTAWTAIALSSLVGFAWAVSNRETTFKHLGINSYGFLNALSFVIVTIVFAEWCMSIWDSDSRIGIYALSIVTIATFWWSIEMMEPTVVNDNE